MMLRLRQCNLMPLRALLNGLEIVSVDYSDDQWSELKDMVAQDHTQLILPCCNQVGVLQKTKGLKYFGHPKPGNPCRSKPESTEYLKSKMEIIMACQENGWKATPEFSESNWRADVLAVKDGMRLAFEVQWPKPSLEEVTLKQHQYKDSNVRGCWLIQIPKTNKYSRLLTADKEAPIFKIRNHETGDIVVDFSNQAIPLKDFVAKLLNRSIKHCEHYRLQPEQDVEIVFFETSCWKCKQAQHLYTIVQGLKSICDKEIHLMGSMWSGDDIDMSPVILAAVQGIMESEKDLHVGQVKIRCSNTLNNSYLSHGCYYCDVIFGDFYLRTEKMDGLSDPKRRIFKQRLNMGIPKQEGPHWCHSIGGEFCE
jgi:hypothetical protein